MKAKSKKGAKDLNVSFTNGVVYITGQKNRGRAKEQFHSYLKACEERKYQDGTADEWLAGYIREGFNQVILGLCRQEFERFKAEAKTQKEGKQRRMLPRSKDGRFVSPRSKDRRFLGPSVKRSAETKRAIHQLAKEKRKRSQISRP